MRIAMVSEFVNKESGLQRYVAEISERFSRTDEVHVFAREWKGISTENVGMHGIKGAGRPYLLGALMFILRSTLRVDTGKFDVVNSQMINHLRSDVVTAQACHKAYFEKVERHKGIRSLVDPFHRIVMLLESYVYRKRRYRKVIAISKRLKAEIIRFHGVPPGDIVVIPSGVNTVDFLPRPAVRRAMRQKMGIGEGDVVFLFVGYEFKRKGLETILRALPRIRGVKRPLLVVVGRDKSGPYLPLIEELGLADNVAFAGHAPKAQDYYNMADAFVFPTRYEPFGLVITEALASGIPVITSRIAGAAEIMEDGREGFLLDDPYDHCYLAEKMGELAKSGELRKAMGANARKTALRYSWDFVVRETRKVFEEVAREKRAHSSEL